MSPELRTEKGGKIYIRISREEDTTEVLRSPVVLEINNFRSGLSRTGFRGEDIPSAIELLTPILGKESADLFVRALMNNEKVSFYFDIHTK